MRGYLGVRAASGQRLITKSRFTTPQTAAADTQLSGAGPRPARASVIGICGVSAGNLTPSIVAAGSAKKPPNMDNTWATGLIYAPVELMPTAAKPGCPPPSPLGPKLVGPAPSNRAKKFITSIRVPCPIAAITWAATNTACAGLFAVLLRNAAASWADLSDLPYLLRNNTPLKMRS